MGHSSTIHQFAYWHAFHAHHSLHTDIPDPPQQTSNVPVADDDALANTETDDQKLLQAVSGDSSTAATILNSKTWLNNTNGARQEIISVAQYASQGGDQLLSKLLDSGLADKTDQDGETILYNLTQLTDPKKQLQQGLNSAAARNALIDNLMADVIAPDFTVVQGNAGTCAPTSAQYAECMYAPEEYIDTMTEMAVAGHSTMAGGGDLVYLPESLYGYLRGGRSITDVIFQDAAMEYANGDLSYNGYYDVNYSPTTGEAESSGLTASEITALAGQLKGVQYAVYGFDGVNVDEISSVPKDKVQAAYDYLQQNAKPTSAIYVSLLALKVNGQDAGGHELLFDHMDEQGNVFLRNPWGKEALPEEVEQLGAQYVADRPDLVEMSKDDFTKAQVLIEVPTEEEVATSQNSVAA